MFAASDKSKITIGKYCAIANGLKIITMNHDYNYPAIQGTFYTNKLNCKHPGITNCNPTSARTKGDVIIGNDVWIGDDVFITSGVTIGNGCCIGAKSVITKDLPAYSICAGIPCKPLKKRYAKETIDFLEEIKWWHWDDDKIKNNTDFFTLNLNETHLEKILEIVK